MNSARSRITLPDPQYGTGKLLRPMAGFEAIYQGQTTAVPLYLFPDGKPLDPAAGTAGISPLLARGVKVSPGSTLLLWLPNLTYISANEPTQVLSYEWVVGWRMRNLFDFRTQRVPYHLPRTTGTPDTTGATPVARTLVPAAWETLVFNDQRPEPANAADSGRAVNHVNAEDLTAGGTTLRGPFLDAALTEGILQQGVADPNLLATSELPSWLTVSKIAKGDEMLLALRRTSGPATWAFGTGLWPANADLMLSQWLGSALGPFPNMGVYLFQGVDPGTITPRSDNVAAP